MSSFFSSLVLTALAAVGVSPGPGWAQDIGPLIAARLQGQTPVRFEPQFRAEFGAFTPLSNTTFKPAGAGPFPAVVMVYTCGGVNQAHMREHSRELFEAGYVVLMQDSHTSRGISTCRERPILSTVGALYRRRQLEEMKAAGAPVQWHVYPGASHAWDRQGQAASGYVYDCDATLDANRRMLEFFNAQR